MNLVSGIHFASEMTIYLRRQALDRDRRGLARGGGPHVTVPGWAAAEDSPESVAADTLSTMIHHP